MALAVCATCPLVAAQTPVHKVKLQLLGTKQHMHFGESVAGLGDITGDGKSEIVVGAPQASPSALTSAGAAFIYSANSGRLIRVLPGHADYEEAGRDVSCAGDVDADGTPDIIVGATGAVVPGQGKAGRAYVYSGATGATLLEIDGETQFGEFGYAVDGAGDVDGDGFADVIVGGFGFTPQPSLDMAGKAVVHSGATGALALSVEGTSLLGMLGWSVAGVGDMDGDGYDDVLFGAPNATFSGTALVYSVKQQTLLAQIEGTDVDGVGVGISVDGAGDIDADGTPDLLLTAPWAGTARVVVYSVAKSRVLLTLTNLQDEHFGEVVANAGDVDGDGTPDVIVGSPRANALDMHESGRVRVFSGQTGALLFHVHGLQAGDHLGDSIDTAGDVDGDGRADVVIGAPDADRAGVEDVGRVLVVGL